MEFPKINPGAPRSQSPAFNSAWCNALSGLLGQIPGREATGSSKGLNLPTDLVKVRNLTGDDRLRGHVVQLGDYLITKLKENQLVDFRHLWFKGELPSDPIRKIAILRSATKADKIGPAQMSGVSTAWVNVTDVDHTHAVPEAENHILQSAAKGQFEILSPLTETGEQEVAVLIGPGDEQIITENALLFKNMAAATFSASSSGGGITPSALVTECVLRMVFEAKPISGRSTSDGLIDKVDDDGNPILYDAVNMCWQHAIKAGDGTSGNQDPVLVEGHVRKYGSPVEEYFIITNVLYPVTVVKGLTTAAVSGGNFSIDGITILWGRDPNATTLSVANEFAWDADDNAICYAMQIHDGTWVAIQLQCPA